MASQAPGIVTHALPRDKRIIVTIAVMMAVPSQALAMLVVWSFIAGFSEKLVPDILAKTEAQLSAAASASGTTAQASS